MGKVQFNRQIMVEDKVYTESITDDYALTASNTIEGLERFAIEQIFRSHGFMRVRLDGKKAIKDEQFISSAFENYKYADLNIFNHAYLLTIDDTIHNTYGDIIITDEYGYTNNYKINSRIAEALNSSANTKYSKYVLEFVDAIKRDIAVVEVELNKVQSSMPLGNSIMVPHSTTESQHEPVVVAKTLINPFQPIEIDLETGQVVSDNNSETPECQTLAYTTPQELVAKYPILAEVANHMSTHGWNLQFNQLPNGLIEAYPYDANSNLCTDKAFTIDLDGLIYGPFSKWNFKWWPYCRSVTVNPNIPYEELPVQEFNTHTICEFLNTPLDNYNPVEDEADNGYKLMNKVVELATIQHPAGARIIEILGKRILEVSSAISSIALGARARFESSNDDTSSITLILDPNTPAVFGGTPMGIPAIPVRFIIENNKPIQMIV